MDSETTGRLTLSKNHSPIHHIPQSFSIPESKLTRLATDYGTPIYIYDERCLLSQWDMLKKILPDNSSLYYSIKANPNKKIIKCIDICEGSFEVASGGELKSAVEVGVSPNKILFIGPGKTDAEIGLSLDLGIKYLVAESMNELIRINEISNKKNKISSVALRLNSIRGKGIISMGDGTQFGMDSTDIINVLSKKHQYKNIHVDGLHSYLGTGILDPEIIYNQTSTLLMAADSIEHVTGAKFSFIDTGGGWGIPYYLEDQKPSWLSIKEPLQNLVENYLIHHKHTKEIAFESGRFIVGPCGVFLTKVLDIKKIREQIFVIVDGGINVFGGDDRYRGFRIPPMKLLDKRTSMKQEVMTICGPLCTSADRLATNVSFSLPRIGDIIGFFQAGAYRYSASPGKFLSHGFPKEIVITKNDEIIMAK